MFGTWGLCFMINTQSLMSCSGREYNLLSLVSNTHWVFVHVKPKYLMTPITLEDLVAI